MPYPSSYMQLKRPSEDPRKSVAYAPTLCGKDDHGVYYYAVLSVSDPLPENDGEVYPTCPDCVEVHERYELQGEEKMCRAIRKIIAGRPGRLAEAA